MARRLDFSHLHGTTRHAPRRFQSPHYRRSLGQGYTLARHRPPLHPLKKGGRVGKLAPTIMDIILHRLLCTRCPTPSQSQRDPEGGEDFTAKDKHTLAAQAAVGLELTKKAR